MSKKTLEEKIREKAKTVEEIIHDTDASLELCDLNCGFCYEKQRACPFRDVKHVLEFDDVLAEVNEYAGELAELLKNRPFKDFVPLENLTLECKECIKGLEAYFTEIEKKVAELTPAEDICSVCGKETIGSVCTECLEEFPSLDPKWEAKP